MSTRENGGIGLTAHLFSAVVEKPFFDLSEGNQKVLMRHSCFPRTGSCTHQT